MVENKMLYWEDIEKGTKVTDLEKTATSQMLVQWAGASGDFNPLHYEFPYAKAQGFKKPIVHGQLKRAWLIQMLTDWIGEKGFIEKFSCQFRRVDYPLLMISADQTADKITNRCKGIVVNKFRQNSKHYIECDIWIENIKGEKTTIGKALISLPTKSY